MRENLSAKGSLRLKEIRLYELSLFLANLNSVRKTRLLEVGVGNGFQASILSKKFDYVGIDVERSSPYVHVIASGEKLPFRNDVFDICFSSNVLEHIQTRDEALAEMKRVTKTSGLIVIYVPTIYWKLLSLIDLVITLIKTKTSKKSAKENGSYIRRLLPIHGAYKSFAEELISYARWEKTLRDSNLKILRIYYSWLYAPSTLLLRSKSKICSCVGYLCSKDFKEKNQTYNRAPLYRALHEHRR